MVHKWDPSYSKGKVGEDDLDRFYGIAHIIKEVSIELQNLGIDRVFIKMKSGFRFTVDYKTDYKTFDTGNVFIETVSRTDINKLGWAFTSCAQYIFYYLPQERVNYIATMHDIRNKLLQWYKEYPTKPAYNEGYKSLGITVPLDVFSGICIARHEIY